jgi:hypothetical protein
MMSSKHPLLCLVCRHTAFKSENTRGKDLAELTCGSPFADQNADDSMEAMEKIHVFSIEAFGQE